ncbi:hypothetical protein G9P44_005416 [Scheffersomyces stipitis]|nr:hypothetical protein G9P44_005416 [Scheffersomyces stipitis]
MSVDVPRKRNRQVFVCDGCRAKKTKCDKSNPCSSCVKLGFECTYTTAATRRSRLKSASSRASVYPRNEHNVAEVIPSLNTEIEVLKSKVRMLESSQSQKDSGLRSPTSDKSTSSPDNIQESISECLNDLENETIKFNGDYNVPDGESGKAPLIFQQPLQFQILSKADPGARLFWKFKAIPVSGRANQASVITVQSTLEYNKKETEEIARKVYGEGFIPGVEQLSLKTHRQEVLKAISAYGRDWGLVFNSSNSTALMDKIIDIIPDRDVSLGLMNVFFSKLYPAFPIVDEQEYENDMERILGLSRTSPQCFAKPKLEKKSDIAALITHLLVMRLTYLSLIENDTSERENEEISILRKSPISVCTFSVVQQCMKEFDFSTRQPLPVLQAALFVRLYRKYAPEEGDGSKMCSQIFSSTLIQMAIALGLNREPDYYLCSSLSEKDKLLRRKIWYTIMSLDLYESMIYASSPIIGTFNHDVKLPMLKGDNSNLSNILLEQKVGEMFYESHLVYRLGKSLANMVSSIHTATKLSEVLGILSELEFSVAKFYGTFSDYINDSGGRGDIFKVLRFDNYLKMRSFTVYVSYCLFLHFEKKGNQKLKLHYLRKSMRAIFVEMKALTMSFVLSSSKYFSSGFSLMVTPTLELYFHMVALVCQSSRIRINCTTRELKRIPNFKEMYESNNEFRDLYNTIREAGSALRQYTNDRIQILRSLSKRYLYSWKASKAHAFGSKLVDSNFIYEADPLAAHDAIAEYESAEIKELVRYIRACISPNESESATHPEITKAEDMQVDNMWIQLNNFVEDDDSLSAEFRGTSGEPDEDFVLGKSSGFDSAFGKFDFDLFSRPDLMEDLWTQNFSWSDFS